jgi:hypothetical protein
MLYALPATTTPFTAGGFALVMPQPVRSAAHDSGNDWMIALSISNVLPAIWYEVLPNLPDTSTVMPQLWMSMGLVGPGSITGASFVGLGVGVGVVCVGDGVGVGVVCVGDGVGVGSGLLPLIAGSTKMSATMSAMTATIATTSQAMTFCLRPSSSRGGFGGFGDFGGLLPEEFDALVVTGAVGAGFAADAEAAAVAVAAAAAAVAAVVTIAAVAAGSGAVHS